MDEDWWASVSEVVDWGIPPQQQQQWSQAPALSISETTVPPPGATEVMPHRQPRSKPRAKLQDRPPCASGNSTFVGGQLKRRHQPRIRGSPTTASSQLTKEPMIPVQLSACPLSNASLQPQQDEIQPAAVPLNLSGLGAVPNAIDYDSIEYMLNALDQCIAHMLLIPTPMETFIRIHLSR